MFVQFSDASENIVISVFAEPQDPSSWPNQGDISEDDQRYQAYLATTKPSALTIALAERDRLLSIAALAIAPLQDSVDLEEATTSELTRLKAWKTYRVAVNRVNLQKDYPDTVEWPATPASG